MVIYFLHTNALLVAQCNKFKKIKRRQLKNMGHHFLCA